MRRRSTGRKRYFDRPRTRSLRRRPVGRPGTDPEVLSWTAVLDSGATHGDVIKRFQQSVEYRTRILGIMYDRFLNRPVDPGGLGHWLREINRGMSLEQIATNILNSPEYLARNGSTPAGFVAGLYRDLLNRPGSAAEIASWVPLASRFPDIVVARFFASGEFQRNLIDSVYRDLLRRPLDPTGAAGWTSFLGQGNQFTDLQFQILLSGEYFTT